MNRQELLERMEKVQNTERYANQDIMTFCGMLSTDELAEHVAGYENK